MNAPSAISPREITFEKPAELYRTIRRRHFSRRIRSLFFSLLPVGIIGVLGVVDLLHKGKSGGGFWLLIGFSVFPIAVWVAHYWATGQIRAAGPAPRYTVRVELERITITSEKGSSTLKWSTITTMWKYPDMIFIFWDKKTDINHTFALPIASLGEDLGKFIEDKVREHGGLVA